MKAILTFIAITFGLSIALGLLIGLTGGQSSPYINLGFASMFIPAIAVSIVRATMNEGPVINWNSFPVRYLPVALLLIPVVMHAVMLPMTIVQEGNIPWQDWLSPEADGLYHTSADRGWGILTKAELIGHIIINAIVGLVAVSFLAIFEEIGWRAWLLPRLENIMGARLAVVVTSLIWGLWHVPFQLSGIQSIDSASTLATTLQMAAGISITGLIIGWLWLRTKSIWIVALTHGALNNWGQYAFKYMNDFKVADEMQVLGASSLGLLVVGIFLLWFCLPETGRKVND
ncbi:MAG TPA: CPBP family intramembrane glutamic endopeptidase [Cyclobacteriaceae bacterium]|jgi:membrane protease YdiL (CAAX protease family)|nr:CPBP family intramembrane glutamic endopeptidase [Cyclobacteriaceae bacterium]